MKRIRLNIDSRKIAARMNILAAGAAQRSARVTQRRVRDNITASGRIRTGDMRRTIRVRKRAHARYDVYSELPYVLFQERGIGPVVPVRAKALRFRPKGANYYVFAQRTRGFEGAFFFERARHAIQLQDFLP